jgi:hypothetical protein
MNPREPDASATDAPTDELKTYFVQEYLIDAGYCWTSLRALPETDYARVMAEATAYASAKISEGRHNAAVADMLHRG